VRIAYLGTSAFAAGVLERIAADGRAPQLVVTRPDRPAGRGRRLAAPPVADTARALGIELLQREAVSEDPRVVSAGFDAVVVCAYGALLKEPLLSEPGLLNIHPSLLPRWRGAAPIERAIMAGDAETGVAIMRPTAGFDEGPVCAVQREPIRPDDDFAALAARLEAVSADLLLRVLDERPPFAEQAADGVVYAEKITAEDRTLDPARPAAELERVVRALHPHVGARVALGDGGFLRVLRARVGDGPLALAAADGPLELLEVQPAGGRPMSAEDYLRGHGPL
jgi:methionyl-tRNA formyltransferase